jgi:hypothetical protein
MRGVIRVALIAVALLGTLAAPVAAGPFEDGVAAYGRADYSTAFQLFRRLAEGIQLRTDRRPPPDITRWNRIAQHLPDRARIDPKAASRFALAQPLYHYRVPHPRIQFHSLHPPTLRCNPQRAIADGFLRRRNRTLRPLQ